MYSGTGNVTRLLPMNRVANARNGTCHMNPRSVSTNVPPRATDRRNGGDVRAVVLGKLDRRSADGAGRSVDLDPVVGLQPPVAKCSESDDGAVARA